MEEDSLIETLRKNWSRAGRVEALNGHTHKVKVYREKPEILQFSDYYHFVFVPKLCKVEEVSGGINRVLNYAPEDFTARLFLKSIHPEDLMNLVDFEEEVYQFQKTLPLQKLTKYKIRYNFRLKSREGNYMEVLHQSLPVQVNSRGEVVRNLVIHTDISSIKSVHDMKLSFIGLEGEPSYLNVIPETQERKEDKLLSCRETEIVNLLIQGFNSREIAEKLFISPATVSTHRKNIHAKAGTSSVVELMLKAKRKGWV